jgi:hypothetical protein
MITGGVYRRGMSYRKIAAALPLLLAGASCVPAAAGWRAEAENSATHKEIIAPANVTAEIVPVSSFRPLDEEQEGLWQQAAGQFDAPSTSPAAPFQYQGSGNDVARALDCLAEAIYYEARSESEEGQRAVAQVVLNRVRHPAFPSSVCGVVYQGSSRRTGCQFSFTCDGSLGRRPYGASWARARSLAAAALSGEVYAPVGNATHYHTRAILPYWAPSLRRAAVVGAHVFYRWRGGQGESGAFRQAYAGTEPGRFTPAVAWTTEARELHETPLVERIMPTRRDDPIVRVHRGENAPAEEVLAENFGVRVHIGEAPTS